MIQLHRIRKIVLMIFCILLLVSGLFPQSVEGTYDLRFESYAKSYRGDWTNEARMIKFSIDSTEIIDNKFPLKISSRNTMRRGGVWDEKKEMLFSRTIILPQYKYGDTCTVSINSKSENMTNWKFEVRGLDENEHILFADSIYIESCSWKINTFSFPLHHMKALRIIIAFKDEQPKENQNAWIDRIRISIGNKDINTMELADFYEGFSSDLDEDYVTPLLFSENNAILKIPEINNKQIIGLGECTHGSQEVKEACYQFMKILISKHSCKAVLFERAPDLCLKWDLYVNRLTSEEVSRDIEVETRVFFDDANSFIDFLKWLRSYNEASQSNVHIFGFDTFSQPHLFFYYYFRLLLGEKCSQPYLQLVNDRNYKEVVDLALGDSQLQSVLNTKDFDYLLFLVEESARTGTIFEENTDREIYMGRRADKIIQLYLKAGDKAVIHAHSSHTNKMNDFFNDVVEKPSMGNYIYRKYEDKYFSIGFRRAKGYTPRTILQFLAKTVTDTLQPPIPTSFEHSALKVNNPYFYYPTDKLPDGISSIRAVGRESKNGNQFFFCSIKKRFDGLVFIRKNSQLHSIEKFPVFYTNGLIEFKDKQQRELLSSSKEHKKDR